MRAGLVAPMFATSLAMAAAMMGPLLLLPARHAAFRSAWSRRHRAIAGVAVGYLGAWCAATLVISLGLSIGEVGQGYKKTWIVGALLLAALWQITPVKRIALVGCHRTRSFAPRGWRADASCIGYGASVAVSCLVSCWALMLVPLVAGHNLLLMAGSALFVFEERLRQEPALQRSAIWLVTGAIIVAVTPNGLTL